MTKCKSNTQAVLTRTYVAVVHDVLDYLKLCRLDGSRKDMAGYKITVTDSEGRSTTICVD